MECKEEKIAAEPITWRKRREVSRGLQVNKRLRAQQVDAVH
jgi:hypothetical protein